MTFYSHDLDVEVAVAAQAEARLSQERTQAFLRRTSLVTAIVLVLLSAATLVYVVIALGRASDAAVKAAEAARGNEELLAAFREEQAQDAREDAAAEAAADARLAEALEVLQEQLQAQSRQRTEQLQVIIDLLVAEVRDPRNQERRGEPRLAPSPRGHEHPEPRTRPSPRPSPRPQPSPRPTPTCATGGPVLGLCVPPP